MDNLNASQDKGAIDHALDTFGNGVMTLAIAVQSKLAANVSSFTYYETCLRLKNLILIHHSLLLHLPLQQKSQL